MSPQYIQYKRKNIVLLKMTNKGESLWTIGIYNCLIQVAQGEFYKELTLTKQHNSIINIVRWHVLPIQ